MARISALFLIGGLMAIQGSVPLENVPNAVATVRNKSASSPIILSVEAERQTFLIGEPVSLNVRLMNSGRCSAMVDLRYRLPSENFAVAVSRDGVNFWSPQCKTRILSCYRIGVDIWGRAHLMSLLDTLAPNEERHIHLKLLLVNSVDDSLLFDREGTWFVRIGHPPFAKASDRHTALVRVHIKAPQGGDKRVFHLLKKADIRRFLERGHGCDPTRLTDILERFPKTGYRRAILSALADFYWRHSTSTYPALTGGNHEDALQRQIAGLLGFVDPGAINDKRLDWLIGNNHREQTKLLGIMLNDLSNDLGIQLQAAPSLLNREVTLCPLDWTIRDCMHSVATQVKGAWEPLKGGYILVPYHEGG
ncbi:MAG: hypothetical protein KatS3mg105_2619 [Gemmatales bacterium]|nr:MAG: hypothetical protein KatS3mg105_2619 [Gemmatales bacterium]